MKIEHLEKLLGFAFFSALNKIIWGAIFLMPQSTFSLAISYKYMSQIASENTWGIVLLITGILHTLALFMHKLHFRLIMQSLSVGIWLFIAMTLALSNPLGTGMYTYGLSAILDFIAVIYLVAYKGGNYQ